LAILIFLSISCQDQAEKAELNKFKAAAKILDQNKEIVREVFTAIDNGNFDKLRELFADDFTLNAPGVLQPWKQDDIFQGIKTYYASFPDWTHTIEDMIAEGDKVAVKHKGQGTFKAQYGGIAATGEKLTQSAMHLMTIVNGKVKEWWTLEDNLGFNQKLGMELKPIKTKK
jgi:predicted ester cyclase